VIYALPLLLWENEFVLTVQLLIQQNYRKIRTIDVKSQIIIGSDFTVSCVSFFLFFIVIFVGGLFFGGFQICFTRI